MSEEIAKNRGFGVLARRVGARLCLVLDQKLDRETVFNLKNRARWNLEVNAIKYMYGSIGDVISIPVIK